MLSAALGVIISSKSSLIGVIRMKELMTQEVIKAPPSVVWDRLTESSNYSYWNDFIKRFEGEPLDGNRLRVSFKIPDKKGFRYFNYRPHVVKADPEKELRWVGNPYLFGFVFSGETHERRQYGISSRRDIQRNPAADHVELPYNVLSKCPDRVQSFPEKDM